MRAIFGHVTYKSIDTGYAADNLYYMMVSLPFSGVWAEKGEGRLLKFLTGKELMAKHKNIILYFIFGVVTTLVNIVAYYICARLLRLGMARSNIAAWIFAVAFAYLTNRKWVFESSAAEWRMVIREIAEFFCAGWQQGGWIWRSCIWGAKECS